MYQSRKWEDRKPWRYLSLDDNILTGSGNTLFDFYNLALGHPDGFPVMIYFNGEYVGIYSLCIKKARNNYQMDKETLNNIHLDGSVNNNSMFNGIIDWTKFEIRNPKSLKDIDGNKYNGDFPNEISSTDEKSKEVKEYIQKLADSFKIIDESENKKETFENIFSLPYAIDYELFSQLSYNEDGMGRNRQWCTWDGNKWFELVYDLDSIWGSIYNGNFIYPQSVDTILTTGTKVDKFIRDNYKIELNQRYKELRDKKIFNTDNIISIIEKYLNNIGYDNLIKDLETITSTASYKSNNINSNWICTGQVYRLPSLIKDFSYTVWNSETTYLEGQYVILDTIKETDIQTAWVFKSIKENINERPVPEGQTLNMGMYNSLQRVRNWLNKRIKFLDTYYQYNLDNQ